MAVSTIKGIENATWNVASTFTYTKKNGVVYIFGKGQGQSSDVIPTGTPKTIGTLPTDCRPSTEIAFAAVDRTNSNNAMLGAVKKDGTVTLVSDGANASYWSYNVSFPL